MEGWMYTCLIFYFISISFVQKSSRFSIIIRRTHLTRATLDWTTPCPKPPPTNLCIVPMKMTAGLPYSRLFLSVHILLRTQILWQLYCIWILPITLVLLFKSHILYELNILLSPQTHFVYFPCGLVVFQSFVSPFISHSKSYICGQSSRKQHDTAFYLFILYHI